MLFCYLRVGRGRASTGTDPAGLDTKWPDWAPAARQAGMQVGGYWRFFPTADLVGQVTPFCGRLNVAAAALSLPPMVDLEDTDGLDRAALTDFAVHVLTMVQLRTGRTPVLYTNVSFLADRLDESRLTAWGLAIARWTSAPAWPNPRADFWQYAGNVRVPWAAGPVDLQRCRIG